VRHRSGGFRSGAVYAADSAPTVEELADVDQVLFSRLLPPQQCVSVTF
jgi:hypothetical protein